MPGWQHMRDWDLRSWFFILPAQSVQRKRMVNSTILWMIKSWKNFEAAEIRSRPELITQYMESGTILQLMTVRWIWNADYLGIGTLESYVKMREYYGKENVCPVYIEVEDGERLARALKRERGQDIPRYEEMCRRFLADQEDFSEEKIAAAGITRKFQNVDLEECVEEIAEYIRQA